MTKSVYSGAGYSPSSAEARNKATSAIYSGGIGIFGIATLFFNFIIYPTFPFILGDMGYHSVKFPTESAN